MQKVKVKQLASYCGHNVKDSGVVNLTLKSQYSEIVNSIKSLQMLNNNVTIKAKIDKESLTIGNFQIKSVNFDGDGESKLNFTSTVDFVNLDAFNKFPLDGKEFWILLIANIEEEKEKENKLDYGEKE